ncbi:GNAT family N-acetyltransferase [Nocardioides baculatus]|uniref:GNAT family N-acetyltransferase n=1 Tax=Nocardioides baculatus TaxID=2801337 RepID=A0ABS1L6W4_9ACTN|nr:GNAT family N-acetyltransferase [Nocardioides baculatus]MBL0747431.1 GNAT family N-acetyltransferase [Nocardioides baculatus]
MTLLVRPMQVEDLPACEAITRTAYFEVDRTTSQRGWPDPQPRSESGRADWLAKSRHKLATDPGGCWVAEEDGVVVGLATSLRRELMWILCSFAVAPEAQGRGLGTLLLDAAVRYGDGCLRGMFVASQDQGALHRYRKAGFDLHPQMVLWGTVRRDLLPAVPHVREGTAADRDLCDSLDRRTRGAAHGPDHELLARQLRLVVIDHASGQGYAYVARAGGVQCLAADNRRTARLLLWESLAASDPDTPVEVPRVTAANQWALDVATAARLGIHTRNFLATRHLKPPTTYIPHSTFL